VACFQLFACALNGATAALLDAGVEMAFTPAAGAVAVRQDHYLLDPSSTELRSCDGWLEAAIGNEGQVSIFSDGALSLDQVEAGLGSVGAIAEKVRSFFAVALEKRTRLDLRVHES